MNNSCQKKKKKNSKSDQGFKFNHHFAGEYRRQKNIINITMSMKSASIISAILIYFKIKKEMKHEIKD